MFYVTVNKDDNTEFEYIDDRKNIDVVLEQAKIDHPDWTSVMIITVKRLLIQQEA